MDVLNFVQNLERKKFYNYVAIFFLVFSLIIGGILFFQFRKMALLEDRLKKLNQSRAKAQTILLNHAFVRQQQEAVKEILEKEKEFFIKGFFEEIVKNLVLDAKKREDFSLTEIDLNNGYIEEQLVSSFKDMSMKDVVNLLHEVEQKERVYVKKIELLKSPKAKKLEVNLIIATLQPKVVVA